MTLLLRGKSPSRRAQVKEVRIMGFFKCVTDKSAKTKEAKRKTREF